MTQATPLSAATASEPSSEQVRRVAHTAAMAKLVGTLLTELRSNRKLTLPKVSTETGLRIKLIDQTEKAEAHPATMIVLFGLLSYYKVSVSDFFKEVEARALLQSFTGDTKAKPVTPYVV